MLRLWLSSENSSFSVQFQCKIEGAKTGPKDILLSLSYSFKMNFTSLSAAQKNLEQQRRNVFEISSRFTDKIMAEMDGARQRKTLALEDKIARNVANDLRSGLRAEKLAKAHLEMAAALLEVVALLEKDADVIKNHASKYENIKETLASELRNTEYEQKIASEHFDLILAAVELYEAVLKSNSSTAPSLLRSIVQVPSGITLGINGIAFTYYAPRLTA